MAGRARHSAASVAVELSRRLSEKARMRAEECDPLTTTERREIGAKDIVHERRAAGEVVTPRLELFDLPAGGRSACGWVSKRIDPMRRSARACRGRGRSLRELGRVVELSVRKIRERLRGVEHPRRRAAKLLVRSGLQGESEVE